MLAYAARHDDTMRWDRICAAYLVFECPAAKSTVCFYAIYVMGTCVLVARPTAKLVSSISRSFCVYTVQYI